jgi:hypothetical protein
MRRSKEQSAAIRAWCRERIRRGKNDEKDIQIQEALQCAKTMEDERV